MWARALTEDFAFPTLIICEVSCSILTKSSRVVPCDDTATSNLYLQEVNIMQGRAPASVCIARGLLPGILFCPLTALCVHPVRPEVNTKEYKKWLVYVCY